GLALGLFGGQPGILGPPTGAQVVAGRRQPSAESRCAGEGFGISEATAGQQPGRIPTVAGPGGGVALDVIGGLVGLAAPSPPHPATRPRGRSMLPTAPRAPVGPRPSARTTGRRSTSASIRGRRGGGRWVPRAPRRIG